MPNLTTSQLKRMDPKDFEELKMELHKRYNHLEEMVTKQKEEANEKESKEKQSIIDEQERIKAMH